jgi:hypothetical protein
MTIIDRINDFFNNINKNKDIKSLNLETHFLNLNYITHYNNLFSSLDFEINSKIIAELFIFRAWQTQFGYRIAFGNSNNITELIISEVIELCKKGNKLLLKRYNTNIEKELNNSIINIINYRFLEYDDLFIENNMENGKFTIPTLKLCGKALDNCGIIDPSILVQFSVDFLSLQSDIFLNAKKIK